MEHHRRQEEHRRVEVEDRGHKRDERERDDEERVRADRDAGELRARRRKQPVGFRDHADEEQARDERERRPHLAGGGGQTGQLVSGCWQNVRPAALAAVCTLSWRRPAANCAAEATSRFDFTSASCTSWMESVSAFANFIIWPKAAARSAGGVTFFISAIAARPASAVCCQPFGSRESRPILKIRRSERMHTWFPAVT